MIFEDESSIRLTRSELNSLRRANAKNGRTIGEVDTARGLLEAVVSGLPQERAEELLAFLDQNECGSGSAR